MLKKTIQKMQDDFSKDVKKYDQKMTDLIEEVNINIIYYNILFKT